MDRHRYQDHQQELPKSSLDDIVYRQPHDGGSQNLPQIGEREIEPQPHEQNHGKSIVVGILLQGHEQQRVDEEGDDQDEDIAVGREERYENIQ